MSAAAIVKARTNVALRRVLCAGAILAGLTAHDAGAQAGVVTLEELAASWSGSRAAPSCAALQPDGRVPRGTERCVWRSTSVGWAEAELWGSRASGQDLDILFWQRNVADSSAAVRVADSLSNALTRGGLQEYGCNLGARRWQMPGLGVELGMTREKDGGQFRVFIAAVTQPGVLPKVMCPDVPSLPIMAQPTVRRRIA